MTSTEHVSTAYKGKIYYFAVNGDKNKNTISSDLIGQFPERWYDGMVYISVAYIYKFNAIIFRPMKH